MQELCEQKIGNTSHIAMLKHKGELCENLTVSKSGRGSEFYL